MSTPLHLTDYPNDELFNRISPLFNDNYQFLMSYNYWKRNKHNKRAIFHAYYRTAPFKGEYAIFAGLDRVVKLIKNFKFTTDDITRLTELHGKTMNNNFFEYLKSLDFNEVKIRAVRQGIICPPNIPLIVVEGPVVMCQLLETPILNMLAFPTLVATYAHRIVRTISENQRSITFVDFGLRRAQGPDGAMTASKYCQIGGFNGTSNMLAGSINGDSVVGTMAHACVMMTEDLDDIGDDLDTINDVLGVTLREFKNKVLDIRQQMGGNYLLTNDGELGAFISNAFDFPTKFVALLDTYNTLESGLLNYICVGRALKEFGSDPMGIRLDSGDLSFLSKEIRKYFKMIDLTYNQNIFSNNIIVASNEISDDVMLELERNGHEIDVFGIGTNIAVCKKSPSIGMVYKVVECDGNPKIKFSEDSDKSTIPYDKQVYRLYNSVGKQVLDLMVEQGKDIEYESDGTILCRHPTKPHVYAYVRPSKIEPLLIPINFDNNTTDTTKRKFIELNDSNGSDESNDHTIKYAKKICKESTLTIREDHMRHLNPTPLKVSLDKNLYDKVQKIIISKKQHTVIT